MMKADWTKNATMGWGMGKGANTVKLVQGIIARVVAAAAEQRVNYFHLAKK